MKAKSENKISKFLNQVRFNIQDLTRLSQNLSSELDYLSDIITEKDKVNDLIQYIELCINDKKVFDQEQVMRIFAVSDQGQLYNIFNKWHMNDSEAILKRIEREANKLKQGEIDLGYLHSYTQSNFVDVLTNNEEINLYLYQAHKILLPTLWKKAELLSVLKILANKSLSSDCIININSVIPKELTLYEITRLKISDKLNITLNDKEFHTRETTLIKNFLDNIKDLSSESLSIGLIKDKIQEACQAAKLSDDIAMNMNHALRFLVNFNISTVAPKFDKIHKSIIEFHKKQEVTSTTYQAKIDESKYFTMTKVTAKNVALWEDFIKQQQNKENNFESTAYKHLRVGHESFCMSLKLFDQDLTDVWIAFIANKELAYITANAFASVEVAVPILTSEHAKFFSAAGIARNANYTGVIHKGLSSELFSLTAKAILQHYQSVPKEKFINQPAEVMHEILYKIFTDNNKNSIFAGDSRNAELLKNQPLSLEKCYKKQASLKKQCQEDPDLKNTDYMMQAIRANNKIIELFKQQKAIEEGKMIIPVKLNENSELTHDFSYEIQNQKGELLQKIDYTQATGEYKWYFVDHPHLFPDGGNGKEISFDIIDAVALAPAVLFEHSTDIGVVGDAANYNQFQN